MKVQKSKELKALIELNNINPQDVRHLFVDTSDPTRSFEARFNQTLNTRVSDLVESDSPIKSTLRNQIQSFRDSISRNNEQFNLSMDKVIANAANTLDSDPWVK
mgnify:CR=1 FL=1